MVTGDVVGAETWQETSQETCVVEAGEGDRRQAVVSGVDSIPWSGRYLGRPGHIAGRLGRKGTCETLQQDGGVNHDIDSE